MLRKYVCERNLGLITRINDPIPVMVGIPVVNDGTESVCFGEGAQLPEMQAAAAANTGTLRDTGNLKELRSQACQLTEMMKLRSMAKVYFLILRGEMEATTARWHFMDVGGSIFFKKCVSW